MARKPPSKFLQKAPGSRLIRTKLKDGKARTISQQRWLLRQLNDPYVQAARKKGYRSRAAFKLLEIDEKFRLLKPGLVVVDLGSTPGGWSQIAAEKVKSAHPKGGKVIALDINEMEPIPGVIFLQGDFREEAVLRKLQDCLGGPVDLVLSDMAAPACGMPDVDHIRIMSLLEIALDFAKEHLREGGAFVAKVLQGGSSPELLMVLKKHFQKVKHFKPASSRQESAEMYVVAQGFRRSK